MLGNLYIFILYFDHTNLKALLCPSQGYLNFVPFQNSSSQKSHNKDFTYVYDHRASHQLEQSQHVMVHTLGEISFTFLQQYSVVSRSASGLILHKPISLYPYWIIYWLEILQNLAGMRVTVEFIIPTTSHIQNALT